MNQFYKIKKENSNYLEYDQSSSMKLLYPFLFFLGISIGFYLGGAIWIDILLKGFSSNFVVVDVISYLKTAVCFLGSSLLKLCIRSLVDVNKLKEAFDKSYY